MDNKNTFIYVLIPIFEDFSCLPILLNKIKNSLSTVSDYRVLIIDDGSYNGLNEKLVLKEDSSLEILTLSKNVGHQRSIAIGLCYLDRNKDFDYILVMDGDGEDNPQDALNLIRAAEASKEEKVIFARRDTRSEPLSFKIGYLLYRLFFRILTGDKIKFGNFSLVPHSLVDRLTGIPDIWNHYAASILSSKIPYEEISSKRSGRIHGRPKMNLTNLILHGMSAFSVFLQIILFRLFLFISIINACGLTLLFLEGLGILNISKFISIIPIIFIMTNLMLISFISLLFVLSNRSLAPCIPKTFWNHYIK